MHEAKEYTYRVFWDDSDKAHIATVAEFPGLSNADEDQLEALAGMRDLLEFVLKDMEEEGETPPVPLGQRQYSGRILLRMPKEVHRRISLEAAEQDISVNQLLVSRI